MISRRRVLTGIAGFGIGGLGLGSYAVAESYGLKITPYDISPPNWPRGFSLRIAVIADLHACDPWMSAARIRDIVRATNTLGADAILLLGDFVIGSKLGQYSTPLPHHAWAEALADLKAPCGVHAVLGNHDWWESETAQQTMQGPVPAQQALEAVGIPVYENGAVRLVKGGQPFWIAGLGDQWAFYLRKHRVRSRRDGAVPRFLGRDDLAGTLAAVTGDAPVILMVHEPDIFPDVPDRVAITLAGHTHGGQVRLLGYAPLVPSRFGNRYVYGHVVEQGRHLVVSAGLGCSAAPVRIGASPEVVVVNLGASPELT